MRVALSGSPSRDSRVLESGRFRRSVLAGLFVVFTAILSEIIRSAVLLLSVLVFSRAVPWLIADAGFSDMARWTLRIAAIRMPLFILTLGWLARRPIREYVTSGRVERRPSATRRADLVGRIVDAIQTMAAATVVFGFEVRGTGRIAVLVTISTVLAVLTARIISPSHQGRPRR